MNALGGLGIWEASRRFVLLVERVGTSEGEVGGDMMNIVEGSGGGGRS
jgi:hypothetical protein